MQIKKSIPIFFTDQLASVKQFYTGKLGLVVTFDSPGYLALKDPNNEAVELGFMNPAPHQNSFKEGMMHLGIEVADVDVEYERLKKNGVQIDDAPVDHPWGDRSFMVRDPIGLTLYVSTPIAPASEYKEYYK
jgi:catechol 2,3-dioxygenase-like lactoylglutathione lyase family enzyme